MARQAVGKVLGKIFISFIIIFIIIIIITRLPLFLYEDAQSKGEKCRMMVSQPTRIAAR